MCYPLSTDNIKFFLVIKCSEKYGGVGNNADVYLPDNNVAVLLQLRRDLHGKVEHKFGNVKILEPLRFHAVDGHNVVVRIHHSVNQEHLLYVEVVNQVIAAGYDFIGIVGILVREECSEVQTALANNAVFLDVIGENFLCIFLTRVQMIAIQGNGVNHSARIFCENLKRLIYKVFYFTYGSTAVHRTLLQAKAQKCVLSFDCFAVVDFQIRTYLAFNLRAVNAFRGQDNEITGLVGYGQLRLIITVCFQLYERIIFKQEIVITKLDIRFVEIHFSKLPRFAQIIDIPIAIIGIESKVFTVVINLVVGIVLGCQPIISYNMGARKYDRVKELYRKILLCTAVIGIASTLLFEIAPSSVVGMFGTPTNIPNPADYWEFGALTFRVFLCLVTFTCTIKMTSIFFQAVGKPIRAVIASMIRDIICFIPLIIILPIFFGIKGILFAAPCADLIAMIVAVLLTVTFMKTLKSKPQTESESAALQPSKKGVIITIAREHGSSGKQIGKLIAERLGIPFYYKEMTALAARESGLDKEFISELNANSPEHLHSLYLSTDVVRQAIIAQDKVIRRIADNGSCVIVGRAADYVLRNYADIVRIFIYADEDYKTRRVMEVYGDDIKRAKENIRRSDEARASYYKNISGLEWGERHNYELLVDGSLGMEKCADIICEYIAKRR